TVRLAGYFCIKLFEICMRPLHIGVRPSPSPIAPIYYRWLSITIRHRPLSGCGFDHSASLYCSV
ncbi:MAG: hypothetical protein WAK08_01455, partial [Pseudolabrys sp.]